MLLQSPKAAAVTALCNTLLMLLLLLLLLLLALHTGYFYVYLRTSVMHACMQQFDSSNQANKGCQ
jgi:4-hydroxybenzoate polyprenyltransferase